MSGFFLYVRLAARSYFTFSRRKASRLSVKRFCVITLFYLVFFPWLLTNILCLSLDHLFFGFAKLVPQPPVFIVGVPRSGTTFLYRLMSTDKQQFTTMPFWELILAPSLIQKYFFLALGRLDAILFGIGRRSVTAVEKWLFGGLDAVHKTSLWEPEEDYFGLIPVAACFLMIQPFPDSERIWDLADFDKRIPPERRQKIMNFYRGILQRHLYFRGNQRIFLSKNPSFSSMIESLRATFPGCRIVGCVRSPLQAVPSLLNFMSQGGEFFGNHFTHENFHLRLLRMFEGYYESLFDQGDKGNLILADYRELTQCPDVLVSRIYDEFALEMTATVQSVLADETENAKCYRSRHQYCLADFGMTEAEVSARFERAFRFFHP